MYKSFKNFAILSFCFAIFLSITNINVLKAQENKNPNPNITKCKIQCDVQTFYDKDVVETKLKSEKGVSSAYLDLDEKIAYIDYDKTVINSEKICKIVKDLGFQAKVIDEKKSDMGRNIAK